MSAPAVRPSEQIIEKFGVSGRYTFLLVGLGIAFLVTTTVLAVIFSSQILSFSENLGLLGRPITIFFALIPVTLGLYLIGRGFYVRLAYEYYLTNQRVMERVGFLAQRTVAADYKTVTDLVVRQDIIGRFLLNTGTLAINTAGGPKEEVILVHIDAPNERREQLRELARAAYNGKKITSALVHALSPDANPSSDTNVPVAELGLDPEPNTKNGQVDLESKVPVAMLNLENHQSSISKQQEVVPNQVGVVDQIEDLHGDGIDESDKVRYAQKKLDAGKEE